MGERERRRVGGMWEAIGRLQFDFLVEHGLEPRHRLLDVGCGCLRGGVHFIRYLDSGNYCGIDSNAGLLRAGTDSEIPAVGLSDRDAHFVVNEDFDLSRFGTVFDYAIAHSLFTHLPRESVAQCLENVAGVLAPGGKFYATYFWVAPGDYSEPFAQKPGPFTSKPDRDPYHYTWDTFPNLAESLPLEARDIGNWGHPRGQRMVEFVRSSA